MRVSALYPERTEARWRVPGGRARWPLRVGRAHGGSDPPATIASDRGYALPNLLARVGLDADAESKCDTGIGEVRAGEGVFGLRRAFHVAGARTVIMSLWPVDDEDALRWMTSVYDRRFRRGAEPLEAVRASSLEQLHRRRKTGLSTHPFYWAAFIAAGDWR